MTPHFTLAEATVTNTGIPNIPAAGQLVRITNTAHNMEIVRAVLRRLPLTINSWFRSYDVNAKVGGVLSSEHTSGAAVDFTCPAYGTPFEICKTLVSVSGILNYNQLILEPNWVHISFPMDGTKGKMETLTARNGKYLLGLIP